MPPKKRASVNLKDNRKKPAVQRKPVDETASSFHDQIAAAAAEQPPTEDGVGNAGLDLPHTQEMDSSHGGKQCGDSILQLLRTQHDHINRLSNTVDELQKSMGEMNENLKTLLSESRQRSSSTADAPSGDQFDLVASVLKEMRSKDEKAERLQLQNDILTLKVRHFEERASEDRGRSLSERSHDPSHKYIDGPSSISTKVPLRGCDDGVPSDPIGLSAPTIRTRQSPEVQISVPAPQNRQAKRHSTGNPVTGPAMTEIDKPSDAEPPTKKPRRYSTKRPAYKGSALGEKTPASRGRSLPRVGNEPVTSATDAPGTTDPGENNALPPQHADQSSSTPNHATAPTAKGDRPNQTTAAEPQHRRRSARSATRMSRRPSPEEASKMSQQVIPASDATEGEDAEGEDQNAHGQLMKEPEQKEPDQDEQERLRKEQIAARDRLVELAMRREEAMDMAEGTSHEN